MADPWFEQSVKKQKAREWPEKNKQRWGKVYLLVGLRAVQDAQLTSHTTRKRSPTGLARVPTATMTLASTVTAPHADPPGDLTQDTTSDKY